MLIFFSSIIVRKKILKVTIFTPTFNRAHKLSRLYNSLLLQGSNDFEWLIIDDGSTDNTREVVGGFIRDEKIVLRYFYQTNGGKHRAHNRAILLAAGDYFLCVDSDDWLQKDAISAIINEAREDYNIIFAYKQDINANLLSDTFPSDCSNTTISDLENEWRCHGEFTIIFRRTFAKHHPFPTFEKERFITESTLYDTFAKQEHVFLLPRVITCCEYQKDGLTSSINQLMKHNPAGYCLYFMQRIDLQKNVVKRWITAGKYLAFCSFAKEKRSVYTGAHRLLVVLAKPLGLLFRYYYVLFRGF